MGRSISMVHFHFGPLLGIALQTECNPLQHCLPCVLQLEQKSDEGSILFLLLKMVTEVCSITTMCTRWQMQLPCQFSGGQGRGRVLLSHAERCIHSQFTE